MPNPIQVEYFAAARDLCGCDGEAVELTDGELTTLEFLELLGSRHERLAPLVSRMRLAINDELAAPDAIVRPGDRVAVLPPVAGGAALCEVRDTPLSIDEVVAAVRHPGAGGIAIFLGVVRDHVADKDVARLDYEAHPSLAQKEMVRVLDEVAGEQPGVRLAAVHRVGQLAIGDAAVVVAASAGHRGQAFQACRDAIDRIKETVPVWKKEWSPDGAAIWVNLED